MTFHHRKTCENNPECGHKICHICHNPMRDSGQKKNDHIGTVPGNIRERRCDRCMIEGHDPYVAPTPTPKTKTEFVFRDERHILLTDKELAHMKQHSKHMYAWTMRRRRKLGLDPARSKTPPVGITKHRDKWKVQLTRKGKSQYFGIYSTMEEAAQVAAQKRAEGY